MGVATCLNITLPVMAENYIYAVTNPKTNTSVSTVMITIPANQEDTEYYIGLLDTKRDEACIIFPGTETKVGNTMKGNCVAYENGDILNWREIKPNTFLKEWNSIINERLQTGRRYKVFGE